MSVLIALVKRIVAHVRYKKRFYYKEKNLEIDNTAKMKIDILKYYKSYEQENSTFYKKWLELNRKYKKIHVYRFRICNVGPLCVYYMYLVELSRKIPKDELLLVMFYQLDEMLLSKNNKFISNKFIYGRISEVAEVISENNVSFWAYVLKNNYEMFDFDWLKIHHQSTDTHEKVYHFDRRMHPDKNYILYTIDEEKIGTEILRKLNVREKKYFCIFSRNNEYHEKFFHNAGTAEARITSLRNSDVFQFCKAVDVLNKYGVPSVRVGAVDSRKMPNQVIDYTNICRSEFGDFFVMGKAKFVIGDNSGILMIPWLQNIPIGVTNNYTILWMGSNEMNYNTHHIYTIYKKWYDTKQGRYLNLREIMEYQKKYGLTDELEIEFFSSMGIVFYDNTEDEIADFALEMNLRIDGKWIEKEEFIDLRDKFWKIVNDAIKSSSKHLCLLDYQPGSLFLKRNKWLLNC